MPRLEQAIEDRTREIQKLQRQLEKAKKDGLPKNYRTHLESRISDLQATNQVDIERLRNRKESDQKRSQEILARLTALSQARRTSTA